MVDDLLVPGVRSVGRVLARAVARSKTARALEVTLLICVIGAGCTGAGTSPGPSDSSGTPSLHTASPKGAGAAEGFSQTAWVAADPETGQLIVGRGERALGALALGGGDAAASWAGIAFLSRQEGLTTVGLAIDGSIVAEHPAPFSDRAAQVRADRDGARLFMHGGADEVDNGVVAIDLGTGDVHTLVDAGSLGPDEERNYFLWSPTGRTLFSSVCNLERCQVDVIDTEAMVSTRQPEAFPLVVGTDAYMLGHEADTWTVLDLETQTAHPAKLEPDWAPRAILPVDDERVLFEFREANQFAVGALDLPSGEVRQVFATSDPSLRLMRMPVIESRWALMSPYATFSDGLAETGTFPLVGVLDIETGQIESRPIEIRADASAAP